MISPKIRSLLEPERMKAWEQARDKTAGPLPDPKVFQSNQLSKYPAWMIRLVTALSLVVLCAAFLPSAYRLHQAGYDTFCLSMNQDSLCNQVGYATVLLAEIGQVIFLLCIAVLARTRTQNSMFLIGAVVSTFIAFVGNAYIANPWNHGQLFPWIETFAPPGIVFLVGYALKELLLHFVEERRATGLALKKAEIERLTRYNHPEQQPDWYRNYSISLRDAIKRANARFKPELAQLTTDEWQHIIKYEMLAGNYTVDPTQETAIERQAREAKEQKEREEAEARRLAEEIRLKAQQAPPSERDALLKDMPDEMRDEAAASLANEGNDEVFLSDPEKGLWTARSKLSGKTLSTEMSSKQAAERRVKDYNYRWQRRMNQKG